MASTEANYIIFKNALLYSVTFRIVNTLDHHSEGDIVALTASAFLGTSLIQSLGAPLRELAKHPNALVTPIAQLGQFFVETATSAGIHMQSNLIASYASTLYSSDTDALYIFLSSVLGLMLIWTLGVSIGSM